MIQNLLTYQEYQKIMNAVALVISENPKSHAAFDLSRLEYAQSAYESITKGRSISSIEQRSYLSNSVYSKGWFSISENEFDRLVNIYGEAVTKIAMIGGNFSSWLEKSLPNDQIIALGGACALESIDTKIIRILQQDNELSPLICQYITRMCLQFPTWTQVTGALIPRHGLNIMYDETFPWYLRFEEYGIQDAESVTQRVYDGIVHAVKRYVRLHDPNNILVTVPFTDLKLGTRGYLKNWFEMVEPYMRALEKKCRLSPANHDPDTHIKAWVLYTYFGPEILQIVKQYLKEKYATYYKQFHIDQATLHVRGKQIDHLDTERSNIWMHSVILQLTDTKLIKNWKKSFLTPFHCQEIAQYQWLLKNYTKLSVGFSGFLDFNYRGKLLHEDSAFTRKELKKILQEGLESKIFDSPLRMHTHNVDTTIAFLERFKNPNAIFVSKHILINFVQVKTKICNIRRKMTVTHNFINMFTKAKMLFQLLYKNKSIGQEDASLFTQEALQKIKKVFIQRFQSDFVLYKYLQVNNQNIIHNIEYIEQFFGDISYLHGKLKLNNRQKHLLFIQWVNKKIHVIVQGSQESLLKLERMKNEQELALKKIDVTMTRNFSHLQTDELSKHIEILPLSNNYFVSYMQQLLFIKPVRDAYINMVQIAGDTSKKKDEKELKIVEVIQRIFPVVQDSIRYIMLGGDYPWNARFKFQFEMVY